MVVFSSLSATLQRLTIVIALVLSCSRDYSNIVVDASITIVDSGKILDSKADKSMGVKLWKGYEYIGRLQYIQTDLQLCKLPNEGDKPFEIVAPPDGLPVALIAKTGGCSLEQKALVASTLIKPANLVAYLIVDDYGRKSKRTFLAEEDLDDDPLLNDYEEQIDLSNGPYWAAHFTTEDEDVWVKSMWEEEEAELDEEARSESFGNDNSNYVMSDDEAVKFVQSLGEPPIIVSDDETSLMIAGDDEANAEMPPLVGDESGSVDPTDDEPPVESYTTFVTLNDDATSIHEDEEPPQKHRVLRRHKKPSGDDRINVAILHVSYKSGYELMDLVLKQSRDSMEAGGPKILLNNKNPSASARTIFLWTMLTILFAAGGCCCLMLFVSYGVEEPPPPPPRPVRRRLTYDQVRANHPAFRFDPEVHVECQLEECAICLDDFEAGQRCRQLPCEHLFHSACIGRWLIERSATCPLCKIDLYEEEESSDDDEEGGDAEAREPEPAEASNVINWWRSLSAIGSSENTAVTTTAAIPNTAAAPTQSTTTEGPEIATSSSWWPTRAWNRRRSPTAIRDGEDNTTTESRPRRGGIWRLNFFGRPTRRRGTEGMLTELTEPLIPGESNQQEEDDVVSEQQNVVSPASSSQEQELDIIPSTSAETTTESSTGTEPTATPPSTAVEV